MTDKTHNDRCREEMTRDVVFLFQSRSFSVVGEIYGYSFCEDGGCFIGDGEVNEKDPESNVEYSVRELFEKGFTEDILESWDTDSVWLTREEAEEFGHQTAYNHKDGWRVYGIPSNGELAKLIQKT